MDTNQIVRQIEDLLFPRLQLDTWERTIYWHLFRHSHVESRPSVVFGLDSLSRATGISTSKLRDSIRSMANKGCVSVDERTRIGHTIKVLLPEEIPGLVVTTPDQSPDIEQIDFFLERRYLGPLMERQQCRCLYCMRAVVSDSAVLDHLVPQVAGGTNSYRNIVVACHDCNARKQAFAAEEFLRMLYRDGILGQTDLKDRLDVLSQIVSGNLAPRINAAEHGVATDERSPSAPARG